MIRQLDSRQGGTPPHSHNQTISYYYRIPFYIFIYIYIEGEREYTPCQLSNCLTQWMRECF
jgi:hypothetical protein